MNTPKYFDESDALVDPKEFGRSTQINKMHAALSVLTLTPHIRDYLKQNDPKALDQALKALES
jgi:hypothetical protein